MGRTRPEMDSGQGLTCPEFISGSRGEKLAMYYVYILHLTNNKLYTGYSGNLQRRIAQHQYGSVESTKNFKPLQLIHYEAYILEDDARRREKYLKTGEGKKFLNRQLSSYLKTIGRYKDF